MVSLVITKLNHQMIHRSSTHLKAAFAKKNPKHKNIRYLAFLLGSLYPLITAAKQPFSKQAAGTEGV